MKFFSVSFLPEKQDINRKAILISILFGDMKSKMLSRMIIICMFICFGFLMSQYELIYYAFLSFIVIPKISELITVFSQIKKNNESHMARRPVTVDFFGDHIIYRFGSTERFRGSFEKHYAFRDVTGVVDSKGALAFSFGERDSVVIPKRALTDESRQMINNLIENLFKSKLIRVDI
ncbi:MAG: hypothetical protein E7543_02015 [Ruminococcaceae bacterium]|nr:hypothetical protein [Oscillospiraceae bacterium]MBQ9912824.1 hypothetical protein [Clostridia bacterium]